MSSVGFFTALRFENKDLTCRQTLTQKVDSYFYFGGRHAKVLQGSTRDGKDVAFLAQGSTSKMVQVAIIVSFFTVIIPLVLLLAKVLLRLTNRIQIAPYFFKTPMVAESEILSPKLKSVIQNSLSLSSDLIKNNLQNLNMSELEILNDFFRLSDSEELVVTTYLKSGSKTGFPHLLHLEANFRIAIKEALELCKREAELIPILDSILTDHPDWKAIVDEWKNVSTEDKIWVLQVYEFHKFYNKCTTNGIDKVLIGGLPLDPSIILGAKARIKAKLATITELKIKHYQPIQKVPSLHLLPNLTRLHIKSPLNTPLNLKHNVELIVLTLIDTKLTTPPDVSHNRKLQQLKIFDPLTEAPNLKNNTALTRLMLEDVKFLTPPDLTNNTELVDLSITSFELSSAPDLKHNSKLENLIIIGDGITTPPDISHNLKLTNFNFHSKNCSQQPDMSKHPHTSTQPFAF